MRLSHFILMLIPCGLIAQEASVFAPPAAYPLSRYEAGWNKNPFTLKTAPVVAATASFAADLAICSYYGAADNPTVVVVNTKTNVRTPLKKGVDHPSGMKLNSVSFGTSRKDVSADITLGTETASLHFNDSYSKQMASAESAKVPPTQQQGQQQGQPPRTQPGGTPVPVPSRPLVPAPAMPQPGAQGRPPGMQGNAQAPFTQPGFAPAQQPRNIASPASQSGTQSPAAQSTAPVPVVPPRIRVVQTPVTNAPLLPQ